MIVWIVSYPRSGNTFLRVILNTIFNIKTYSIYDDKADIGADAETSNIVGHRVLPEGFNLSSARGEDELYFIKTHELPGGFLEAADKIIYLLRDGRECSYSYLRYNRNYNDVWFSALNVIYGNVFSGSWGEHVKAWCPAKRDNTLLIRFEELVDKPEGYVEKISSFLSLKPSGNIIPTFEELNKINPSFFNSGEKASWMDAYSEDEVVAFWMKNHTQMIEYGYVNNVPEIFASEKLLPLFKSISAENSYLLNEVLSIKNIALNDNKKIKLINDQLSSIAEKQEGEIRAQKRELDNYKKELDSVKHSRCYKIALKLSNCCGAVCKLFTRT